MKKVSIALSLIFVSLCSFAQQKIGYINSQEIISLMPETKKATAEAEAYKKTFSDQMTSMQKELETKFKDYQDKQKTMSDAIKTVKEKELQDLQGRIGSFEQTANEKIEDKLQELLAPINERAQKAIEATAKEKDYAYIFDTSAGGIIYALPSDNIISAVKLKLGIKDTPTTPSNNAAPKK
jgi:outer membrane protein